MIILTLTSSGKIETDFSLLTNKINYRPQLPNSVLTSASPVFSLKENITSTSTSTPSTTSRPVTTVQTTMRPKPDKFYPSLSAWYTTVAPTSILTSVLPTAWTSPLPVTSPMHVRTSSIPVVTSEHAISSSSKKPWSPWPALKPVPTRAELPSTSFTLPLLTRTVLTTPMPLSTSSEPAKIEIVLEKPKNKKRTYFSFATTTRRVARIFIQPKKVVTTVVPFSVAGSPSIQISSTLAPVNNTNNFTNASSPASPVAAPSFVPPVPTRSVDISYRSRLITGTVSSFTTVVPNSTSSLNLSSSSFTPTNTGPEGRVEETEASLHLGDASIGGLVTAVVMGTLAILGALAGLGFWAWKVHLRMAAGATVSG